MTDQRTQKGEFIANNLRIIKVKGEDAWLVESQTNPGDFYKVKEDGECECPDYQNRHNVCKHVRGVVAKYSGYTIIDKEGA